MVINWYGESCFKIQSGETVILTDPFESSSGLTPPRFRADLILKSAMQQPSPYFSYGTPTLTGPGEYDVKEVEITGLANKTSTVYLIKMEDFKLCFLDGLSQTLEPAILEKMDSIDILFIPAGGQPFIEQDEAAKLIKKINPKIVIPSLFKIPGLKRKSDDLKEFLKAIGQKEAEPQEKLTVKKKDLPPSTRLVVLKI